MGQLYGDGAGNKLEAAKQAIQSTNTLISGWENGSRFGLITYYGGQNGVGNPATYEVVTTNQLAFQPFWGGLTSSEADFNNKLNSLSANGSTPTYHALNFSKPEMAADSSGGRLPTFILITDGVPTISGERYSFNDSDVQAISIQDEQGNFRSAAEVRVDGGSGGAPGYFNGEPLADVMEEIDAIMQAQPDYTFHAIGIQGQAANTFNSELLEYVAFVGGGIFADPTDFTALTEVLEQAVEESACTTPPSVTQLTNFDTTLNEEGDEILVTWQTVVEVDTEGFNLYRTTDPELQRHSTLTEGYEKLNDELIRSQAGANGQGTLYEWPDSDNIENNTTYHYLLEEVKRDGESTPYEEEIAPNQVELQNMLFLPILRTR
jgi:hypothetical protein